MESQQDQPLRRPSGRGGCNNVQKPVKKYMIKSLKISAIDSRDVVIPSVVRFELFYGAYKSKRKEETLKTLGEFLNCFKDAGFDGAVSDLCGRIRADLEITGTPIGPYDLQIGAIVLANNFIHVTNNTKEFSRIKNLVIKDWDSHIIIKKHIIKEE